MSLENLNLQPLENTATNLLNIANQDGIQKLVVGGVIFNQNKQVLVLKREASDFMGGLVELPSGGCDTQDLLKELIREIEEETGINITPEQIRTYIDSFDYTSGSGKKARQFNFSIQLNQEVDVKLNPSEHTDFYWVSDSDLENYNISESTKQIIRQAIGL